jgi:2-C-methyl-D-erythritol 4-phosphate cytidylyltransferase/2-C-methyl-D-erythritol 2,4-cyclodiphosphate synthase
MGGDVPKQYRPLGGKPMLRRTIEAFMGLPGVEHILTVIQPGDLARFEACIGGLENRFAAPVIGGETRQQSVWCALRALEREAPQRVLIHDAARPLVDAATIRRVLDALDASAGAIAALPVVDTLKRSGSDRGASDGRIVETVDRQLLWRAQTPQGFAFEAIASAHRKAMAARRGDFTDDAQIAEWAGLPVKLVMGAEENFKVTTEDDLLRAERIITLSRGDIRTGTGFDVHRFAQGDRVWLCGVMIPHDRGLEGHSDADVGLHALTDAILGAIGDGDIGQHFPPGDPKWKGAASRVFLADAARRVSERGGVISNVDVTLLCESPRIGPHREAMRAAIATILCLDIGRVGVKATTTEGLGFTGRREGIAAMASATVRL